MWRSVWCLLSVAACNASDDRRPSFPDNDGGNNPPIDAPALDAADAAPPARITGNVCLVNDLRLGECDAVGPGALQVTLGTNTAPSAPGTGAFSIETDPAATAWTVSGPGIRTSRIVFDPAQATGVVIPIVSLALYDSMLAANDLVEDAGEGAAVLLHLRAGNPLPGVAVSGGEDVLYDGGDPLVWVDGKDARTGARGMAWVANLAVGNVTLASEIAVGEGAMTTLAITEDGITFHVIEDL